MNKKYLIPFLIIILLACDISSPSKSTSPTPQVVFRSPRDMNLQPQDVPDLTETSVEKPATEPLLPEAIDQDQRAYISQTKDIYIESNAIMVPEKTKRESKEIIYEVVNKYHPKVVFENKEQNVHIGDDGTIITINNFCSSDYSNGLVLIILRNNMIVLLTGCGPDITQDYILHLGEIIDNHITAPPQPYEIDVTSSEQDLLDEVEAEEVEEIPEIVETIPESAIEFMDIIKRNEGLHQYQKSGKVLDHGTCGYEGIENDYVELEINFSDDGNCLLFGPGSTSTCEWSYKGEYSYEQVETDQYGTYYNIVTFNNDGFIVTAEHPGCGGKIQWIYIRIE